MKPGHTPGFVFSGRLWQDGRMNQPASLLQQIHLAVLVDEVLASAAIEGMMLPRAAVLAAVARRLGLEMPTQVQASRGGARKVGRRQRKLVELLVNAEGGWIDVRGYMAEAGVSKATATRDLAEMVVRGQLKRVGTGKASRYSLRRID